jgi:hypothetical protein
VTKLLKKIHSCVDFKSFLIIAKVINRKKSETFFTFKHVSYANKNFRRENLQSNDSMAFMFYDPCVIRGSYFHFGLDLIYKSSHCFIQIFVCIYQLTSRERAFKSLCSSFGTGICKKVGDETFT